MQADISVASIILLLKPCCVEFPCNIAPVPVYLYCPCFINRTPGAQGDVVTCPRSQTGIEASSMTQAQWEFLSATTWSLDFSSIFVVSCCHRQVFPRCWHAWASERNPKGWGGISLSSGQDRAFPSVGQTGTQIPKAKQFSVNRMSSGWWEAATEEVSLFLMGVSS